MPTTNHPKHLELNDKQIEMMMLSFTLGLAIRDGDKKAERLLRDATSAVLEGWSEDGYDLAYRLFTLFETCDDVKKHSIWNDKNGKPKISVMANGAITNGNGKKE